MEVSFLKFSAEQSGGGRDYIEFDGAMRLATLCENPFKRFVRSPIFLASIAGIGAGAITATGIDHLLLTSDPGVTTLLADFQKAATLIGGAITFGLSLYSYQKILGIDEHGCIDISGKADRFDGMMESRLRDLSQRLLFNYGVFQKEYKNVSLIASTASVLLLGGSAAHIISEPTSSILIHCLTPVAITTGLLSRMAGHAGNMLRPRSIRRDGEVRTEYSWKVALGIMTPLAQRTGCESNSANSPSHPMPSSTGRGGSSRTKNLAIVYMLPSNWFSCSIACLILNGHSMMMRIKYELGDAGFPFGKRNLQKHPSVSIYINAFYCRHILK